MRDRPAGVRTRSIGCTARVSRARWRAPCRGRQRESSARLPDDAEHRKFSGDRRALLSSMNSNRQTPPGLPGTIEPLRKGSRMPTISGVRPDTPSPYSARKINHKNHKGRANGTKSICVFCVPFVIFVVNSPLNAADRRQIICYGCA
jgi:hypothetical protein